MTLSCAKSDELGVDGTGGVGEGATGGSAPGTGGGSPETGGSTGTGGLTGTGGASTGGTTGSGGTGGLHGTGGSTATGGNNGSGGVTATGGATGTGGITASGGSGGRGGGTGTGGMTATGGHSGATGTGGVTSTGGTTGTGGMTSTGGTTGTGGTTSTGGACTWSGGPSSTSGELTCYYFGQGTAKGGGCSNYKTYCGYCGNESGSNGGGACYSGISDTVPNIGTGTYFAAFPSGSFGQGKYCGMCVDVTYSGKTITATIVDECATCPSSGHIDLSLQAASALGLGQGKTPGDVTGVTWKAVDCPVSGNITGTFNNGNSGQVYFQNVVFPVAKAVAGGHTANQSYGYWDFGASVGGQSVQLTDTVGHTITGTMPSSSGGSVGAQFPMTCQ
ncbi:MAG TPA: hypothetical protein VMT03_11715 [Polyangia bacterium]|nr:hypothetical protein [Polyangia bacterium]